MTLCRQCEKCEILEYNKTEKYTYRGNTRTRNINFTYCKQIQPLLEKYPPKIIYSTGKQFVGYYNPEKKRTLMYTGLLKTTTNPRIAVKYLNDNRLDISLKNLEEIDRTIMNQQHYSKGSSQYPGVQKVKNRYYANITINGKTERLGIYDKEADAFHAYLLKCKEINRTINTEAPFYKRYLKEFNPNTFQKAEVIKKHRKSKYPHVTYIKRDKKYYGKFTINGQTYRTLQFNNEEEAHIAVEKLKKEKGYYEYKKEKQEEINKHTPVTYLFDEHGGIPYIKNKIQQGLTLKQIGESVGYPSRLAYKRINAYLQSKGYAKEDLGYKSKSLSSKEIDQLGGIEYLKKEKSKGLTLKQISKKHGYSNVQGIVNYLKKHNTSWKQLEYTKVKSFSRLKENKRFSNYVLHEYHINHKNKKEIITLLNFTEEYFDEKLADEDMTWETLTQGSYNYVSTFHKTSKIDLAGGMEYLIKALNQKSVQKVSEELGYKSSSAIRIYVENRGLTFDEIIKNKPVYQSPIDQAGGLTFVLENRLKGKTLTDIAKKVNLKTSNVVGYYLNRKGYMWRKLPDPIHDIKRKNRQIEKIHEKHKHTVKKRGNSKPSNFLEKIIHLIMENYSKKEVAEYFNVTSPTIDSWLRFEGWSWKSLNYELKSSDVIKTNVYYIVNKGKYRGTCNYYGRLFDTDYYDSESEVLDELKKLRMSILLS